LMCLVIILLGFSSHNLYAWQLLFLYIRSAFHLHLRFTTTTVPSPEHNQQNNQINNSKYHFTMKFTYLLYTLIAGAANARNIVRQAETIGSIDRWNNHQCDAPGPSLACHVREQGDVNLGICNPTTDIDHFGGCRGSAAVSSLRPGCSSKFSNRGNWFP